MKLKIPQTIKLSANNPFITGVYEPPPDKSISHRSIIFSSLSQGNSKITNLLISKDTLATVGVMRALGIKINRRKSTFIVRGKGLNGFKEPENVLNAYNSGTTIRLISGILSAQKFISIITGDYSLRKRPMKRIIDPLSLMGAKIYSRKKGLAPLVFLPSKLKPINYKLPIPSAQVKSAIILASLFTDSESIIEEPIPSRNHTELMLNHFGVKIIKINNFIHVHPPSNLNPVEIHIPGDISSASFFITLAALLPDSKLTVKNIGLNPTRNGLLVCLKQMGANINFDINEYRLGEPVGTLSISSSNLKPLKVQGNLIPSMIDEIPLLALLATQAQGTTIIENLSELKYKESNRLLNTYLILKNLGAKIQLVDDSLVIDGKKSLMGNVIIDSFKDNRSAMMAFIAGVLCEKPILIKNFNSIKISYPSFLQDALNLIKGINIKSV